MNHPLKLWYALYTISKHEKKICFYLDQKKIQSFLPMTTEIRQWSDRKKKLVLPLFPNYVFVHIRADQLWKVTDVPGAVKFVGIGKKPSPIPDKVIEALQRIQFEPVLVEDLNLHEGERVRITNGNFMGLEGKYIRAGAKKYLAIEVEIMNRSVLVEIEASQVERICNPDQKVA